MWHFMLVSYGVFRTVTMRSAVLLGVVLGTYLLIFFFGRAAVFSFMVGSGVPRNFIREWVQQIQLRTEDRENRDLGAVAP